MTTDTDTDTIPTPANLRADAIAAATDPTTAPPAKRPRGRPRKDRGAKADAERAPRKPRQVRQHRSGGNYVVMIDGGWMTDGTGVMLSFATPAEAADAAIDDFMTDPNDGPESPRITVMRIVDEFNIEAKITTRVVRRRVP